MPCSSKILLSAEVSSRTACTLSNYFKYAKSFVRQKLRFQSPETIMMTMKVIYVLQILMRSGFWYLAQMYPDLYSVLVKVLSWAAPGEGQQCYSSTSMCGTKTLLWNPLCQHHVETNQKCNYCAVASNVVSSGHFHGAWREILLSQKSVVSGSKVRLLTGKVWDLRRFSFIITSGLFWCPHIHGLRGKILITLLWCSAWLLFHHRGTVGLQVCTHLRSEIV